MCVRGILRHWRAIPPIRTHICTHIRQRLGRISVEFRQRDESILSFLLLFYRSFCFGRGRSVGCDCVAPFDLSCLCRIFRQSNLLWDERDNRRTVCWWLSIFFLSCFLCCQQFPLLLDASSADWIKMCVVSATVLLLNIFFSVSFFLSTNDSFERRILLNKVEKFMASVSKCSLIVGRLAWPANMLIILQHKFICVDDPLVANYRTGLRGMNLINSYRTYAYHANYPNATCFCYYFPIFKMKLSQCSCTQSHPHTNANLFL